MSEQETFSSSSDEQSTVAKCNWCNRTVKILPGYKHCHDCHEKAYRICVRCRRPLSDKSYFALHDKRCNACQKSYLRQKRIREEKKSKLQKNCPKTLTRMDVKLESPTSGETSDTMLTKEKVPVDMKPPAPPRLALLKRRQRNFGKPPYYIVLPLYSQDVVKSNEIKNE